MHDLIFNNQPDLAFDSYRKFAQEIGVDMTKFDECMSRHRYEELILTDIREGRSYGVSGTPTFFIIDITYQRWCRNKYDERGHYCGTDCYDGETRKGCC